MIQEEIARLTGKLVFTVDNRPLMAFEKRLDNVLSQLRQLQSLANKKFIIKVQLDSRSLREQLAKVGAAKITLRDFNVSQEALGMISKRITERLGSTPITLNKVRVDISSLMEQKKLVRTLLGQMQVEIPIKPRLAKFESDLRQAIREVETRNPIKLKAGIDQTRFISDVRRSLRAAASRIGMMKINIQNPELKLKVDRDHLRNQIRSIVSDIEYQLRLRLRMDGGVPGSRRSASPRAERARAAIGGGLAGSAMHFARGALPGLGAAFAISAVNDINQQLVASRNSLEAVSGSADDFASNMAFLTKMSKEQGLTMRAITPQFSSILQAAKPALGTQGVQDMFRGIMKYGTTHGLDKEAMKGSMVALSQMFGKDKIQSEEARQQFSERMPGGMQLLATAAMQAGQTKGGTVKEFGELMQKGNADPKKILPELGKLMEQLADANGAYARSLLTTRVAQGRMNATFEDSVSIFADGGFDKGMGDFFRTMSEGMRNAEPLIKALGAAFDVLIRPINALILIVGKIGEEWENIAKVFGMTGGQLAILASIAGVAALPFGTLALAISAVALAVQDVLTYMDGGNSVFGKFLESSPAATEALAAFSKEAKQFGEYMQAAVTGSIELGAGLKGLSFPEFFVSTMQELTALLKLFNDTVDRFVQAGLYAKMMNPDATDSNLSMNVDNIKAMAMGPDWARQQMSNMTAAQFAAQGVGSEVPGKTSLGSNEEIAEVIARALADQRVTKELNSTLNANINVNVAGGLVSAGDLTMALEQPMKEIALKAFGDSIMEARSQQSEVRK